MVHPVHLFAVVLTLVAAGCGRSGTPVSSPDQVIHVEETKDPGHVVDTVGGRGLSAVLYDRYRIGVCLSGVRANPGSVIDVWLAMVRVRADEPMPEAVPIVLELDSDSLPRWTVAVRAKTEGEFGTFKVSRRPTGLLRVDFNYVYGRAVTTHSSDGLHEIRVRIGLDGKEPVTLPGVLQLQFVSDIGYRR